MVDTGYIHLRSWLLAWLRLRFRFRVRLDTALSIGTRHNRVGKLTADVTGGSNRRASIRAAISTRAGIALEDLAEVVRQRVAYARQLDVQRRQARGVVRRPPNEDGVVYLRVGACLRVSSRMGMHMWGARV